MARRSSARLRAKVTATPQPQRVSNFGHDGALQTPKTAPKLSSLAEADEMPGAFPQSASPTATSNIRAVRDQDANTTKIAQHIAKAVTRTPGNTTPIKPSNEEMHPQKFHMSTTKALDEARWLGFSSMATAPHTEPAKAAGTNKIAAAQGTPTRAKSQKRSSIFGQPADFQFTFSRPSFDMGLSEEARKLMAEKKAEAAKIMEQMKASEEFSNDSGDVLHPASRRFATPKAKVGRFSDVHMSEFKKMDSIANHPSAFRADQGRAKDNAVAPQSLKRTQSKADLHQPSTTQLPRPSSKGNLQQRPQQTPQSTTTATTSTAKRVKRVVDDDAGTSRLSSHTPDMPATPKHAKPLKMHPSNPNVARGATTPTAASLARAASAKSALKRTMIPGLNRSPSKPSTASTTAAQSTQPPVTQPSFLNRSPSKMTLPKPVGAHAAAQSVEQPVEESPFLTRSPVKPAPPPKTSEQVAEDASPSSKIPFLSRSPTKMSAAEHTEQTEKPTKTPLLARSPSKIAMPENAASNFGTPAKSSAASLISRFNLLRKSPIKSILRTPQRLYSDDPAKIASGTHLRTPERASADLFNARLVGPPKTAPVQKHVDFSASTKGKDEQESTPATPSKSQSLLGQKTGAPSPAAVAAPATSSNLYPTLPAEEAEAPVKKSHRRMTMAAAPSDFTFRAGSSNITFGPSPQRPHATDLKASIRHVSAEPDLGASSSAATGQKRKLSASSASSAPQSDKHAAANASDKENDDAPDEQARPAKKLKAMSAGPSFASRTSTEQQPKTPKKMPTLGVRPKSTSKPKEKRPGVLSQARLNALATPKRR